MRIIAGSRKGATIHAPKGLVTRPTGDRVREVAFVPLANALAHLDGIAWHSLIARYLRGELPPGSVWLRRVHPDGAVAVDGPF